MTERAFFGCVRNRSRGDRLSGDIEVVGGSKDLCPFKGDSCIWLLARRLSVSQIRYDLRLKNLQSEKPPFLTDLLICLATSSAALAA
jgi:hypothetical protein